jgi:hypothetical protein
MRIRNTGFSSENVHPGSVFKNFPSRIIHKKREADITRKPGANVRKSYKNGPNLGS